ncbi:nuclear factor 7, ovary-like [Melanotaenia boesemani]|uniref:nuclear factor 7, ovary-like n=1 Tax=Melanotaenia boesemani TaxID=1250792 RepID=UPI001C046411|nr:nuclear factor 7, ovary-like [Melanotaenia boesemani]
MAAISGNILTCPLCQDICKHPVMLSCNHSFCYGCLQTQWANREISECPVCKRKSSKELLPILFAIMSKCEVSGSESVPVCSLHGKKLSFLCLDDQQLICSSCMDSETHSNHTLQPTNEAAQARKKELQDSLKPLRKKLRLIHQVKGNYDQTAEHIKVQAERTVRSIKEEFKRLHQFLIEEEEARLVVLREEEELKSQMMKDKIGALSKEITALSDIIRATEKELRAQDVSFLQSYKAAAERVQQQPLSEDPELISGALINVAHHLGNLSFNVWNKMKEMVSYSPVILDPNTAHPDLLLSEDLTGLRQGEGMQEVPDNPERIDHFISVVGSEGFDSGRHSWEVEVGDNNAFVLGVLMESNQRKGLIWPGLWRLMFCRGEYKTLTPSDTGSDVSVMGNPKKIRVLLDWDGGQLSFSDAETGAHIHTFTHTFTDKMLPYISTWSESPIKIAARTVSVAVEPHG